MGCDFTDWPTTRQRNDGTISSEVPMNLSDDLIQAVERGQNPARGVEQHAEPEPEADRGKFVASSVSNSHFGYSWRREPAKAETPNAFRRRFQRFGVPPLGGPQPK